MTRCHRDILLDSKIMNVVRSSRSQKLKRKCRANNNQTNTHTKAQTHTQAQTHTKAQTLSPKID